MEKDNIAQSRTVAPRNRAAAQLSISPGHGSGRAPHSIEDDPVSESIRSGQKEINGFLRKLTYSKQSHSLARTIHKGFVKNPGLLDQWSIPPVRKFPDRDGGMAHGGGRTGYPSARRGVGPGYATVL